MPFIPVPTAHCFQTFNRENWSEEILGKDRLFKLRPNSLF